MNARHQQSASDIARDFAHLHSRRTQVSPGEVYYRYLLAVRLLAGADSASLLVESKSENQQQPLLIHEGGTHPLPELVDEITASTTVAAFAQQQDGDVCYSGNHQQHALIRCYVSENGVSENGASENGAGCLLRIAASVTPWPAHDELRLPVSGERRDSGIAEAAEEREEFVWIGLRYDSGSLPDHLALLCDPGVTEPQSSSDWLAHILVLGASWAWETCQLSSLLRDPTSQLPGQAEFQARLKRAFHSAANSRSSLGLLLINPDEFGVINQRLDRESGDRALAEVAATLRDCLRRSDPVFRYGGAVFAALMPNASEAAVDSVAVKVREALTGAYLDGAVRLSFSVGAVVFSGDEQEQVLLDEFELLRRADHALNLAKRAGGGCSVLWSSDQPELPGAGQDRLSGIFTANVEKDYRNMLLLWDTIAVISSGAKEEQIAADFVARVNMSLKPNRIGLIAGGMETGISFLAAAQRSATTGAPYLELSEEQRQLLKQVEATRLAGHLEFDSLDHGAGEPVLHCAYAVPLLAGETYLGCLYIDGPEHSLALDSSDRTFLNALASQVALALDRADLTARWKEESDREQRRLREEVHGLRQVVTSARLVYRSQEMQNVLDTLRSVAPTDVTILINGESGTGKEMLARAVHEMGSRKDQPMITVDCGAIAHNLLEAELFGHVKGAYTGADSASAGRIAQADGGTLFLDEIGELPLDLQAKLLRFVQEKEISPVGATSSRRVDVRIVAATNRDLATEAAAGRFRQDLFYRLKVVTLTAPPLRDRPSDILPLATHFLAKFALQYEKGNCRFAPATERMLQEYQWPGNVRELQNSILRAVVLSKSGDIDPDLLQFEQQPAGTAAVAESPPRPVAASEQPGTQQAVTTAPSSVAQPNTNTGVAQLGDPWEELERGLIRQVEIVLTDRRSSPLPLGRWLIEDLVLAADNLAWGVARRASAQLGVAETTYRRQLEKIQRAQSHGLLQRSPAWADMHAIIAHVVQASNEGNGNNLLDAARALLLVEVAERTSGQDNAGAALMGVTIPTYRRWAHKS